MPNRLKIIGIDPGSRVAGYGLVELCDGDVRYLLHGAIVLPANGSFESRLLALKNQLHDLIRAHAPDVAVVERVFLGKNADSAFKLGHARGVCIAELASGGASIVEYAARQVKKGVTGSGAATKEQVGMLVTATLKISPSQSAGPCDATDALALAYYHAIQIQVEARMKRGFGASLERRGMKL